MQQTEDVTQKFHKVLRKKTFHNFLEELCKQLEIEQIDVCIEKSISLKQFQTLGKILPIDQLAFRVNMNSIFAYGPDIYQKSKALILLELKKKAGLPNVIQTLEAFEYKIQWAIQPYEKFNPITFLNKISFNAIYPGEERIERIVSSNALNLRNKDFNQIQNEINYRYYLLDSIYSLVKEQLSKARYEEKKDAKFIWKSKNAKFDLTEIALVITKMTQFDHPKEAPPNIFIERFLALFNEPSHKISHDIGEIKKRTKPSKLSKDFYKIIFDNR
ncbi:MAG: hypothetical protein JST70_15710 [Bacteroidetes bacterium]|nr:hypothetical protein [Bacteroidota bacterium]